MRRFFGVSEEEGIVAVAAGLARVPMVLALPFLLVNPAGADFRLSDPASGVYYRLAVAAEGDVEVAGGASVEGDIHSNDRVALHPGALVDGDVSAAGRIDDRGTISGTATPGAARVELPGLFTEEEARALADRVFEKPTAFSDTILDDVVFVDGNVRITGAVNGTGTIIATGNIEIERVDPGTGEGLLDPATRLSLIAFQHVKLHDNRSLRGVLYAGSHVMIEKDARFEGVLVAGQKVQVRQGAVVEFLNPDVEPPVIFGATPADGSFVASARPQIAASFGDDVSGVAVGSVQLLVDDVDRTGEAQIGPGGLTFVPGQDLAEGGHTVRISLLDHSGKPASLAFAFGVDTVAPGVTILYPEPGRYVSNLPPEVRLAFSDAGSGVDPETFGIALGSVLPDCDVSPEEAFCRVRELQVAIILWRLGFEMAREIWDRPAGPSSLWKTGSLRSWSSPNLPRGPIHARRACGLLEW